MLSLSKILQEHGNHAVIQNWLQKVVGLGDSRAIDALTRARNTPTISLPTTLDARRADFPRPPFVRPGDAPTSWSTIPKIRSDKHFYPGESRATLHFRRFAPFLARSRSG